MANKAFTFLVVMSGIMLLFYIGGLIDTNGSPTSTLLTLVFDPENIPSSAFITGTVLGALSVIGIVAISKLTNSPELAIKVSITTYLLSLGWDFLQVYAVVASASQVIAVLIFGPILLGYVITMLEFWWGRD